MRPGEIGCTEGHRGARVLAPGMGGHLVVGDEVCRPIRVWSMMCCEGNRVRVCREGKEWSGWGVVHWHFLGDRRDTCYDGAKKTVMETVMLSEAPRGQPCFVICGEALHPGF